jgi:hypothetical protein
LAAVISGAATADLLETYAAERHPAARRIVSGTRRATRMTLFRRRPAVFARRHVAPVVLRRAHSTIERALSQLDISYRAPGAVSDHSLVTGDRAPDAPLRHLGVAHPHGTPVTRLFDVIRRDEFSLMMVGTSHDIGGYEPTHRVLARFPTVRPYVILPDDTAHDDFEASATALVDVGNTLRRKYRIDRRAMLLIRPDGYLALRHDEWAPEILNAHLPRWLVPARSTQLEEA